MKPKRIYLDYAASTPVDPAVLKIMAPYWSEKFGNPGSVHSFGQEAQNAVDKARESVAKSIGAEFRNVIFTGSATEANNLALRGTVRAAGFIPRGAGRSSTPAAEADLHSRRAGIFDGQAQRASESRRSKQTPPPDLNIFLKPKIIISSIEHDSILDTARDLEKEGVETVYVPVDKNGVVDLKKIKEALDERTILVSVMYVQNEIGSVQPIAEIADIIRNFRVTRNKRQETRNGQPERNAPLSLVSCLHPLFHTDAAQALNYFDCDVEKLGVDLMTLSGQKIYGPKGIGALYMRQETRNKRQENKSSLSHVAGCLYPIITGGGQEFGLRSGTENVPAIVGFEKAVELAIRGRSKDFKEVKSLRDYFWRGLKKIYPQAEINGDAGAPHILNIHFPTEYAGDLLVKLDMAGVAVSAGSVCSARSFAPSHVLQTLGLSQERVRGSLRFSFGKDNTRQELDAALKIISRTLS